MFGEVVGRLQEDYCFGYVFVDLIFCSISFQYFDIVDLSRVELIFVYSESSRLEILCICASRAILERDIAPKEIWYVNVMARRLLVHRFLIGSLSFVTLHCVYSDCALLVIVTCG